MKKIYVQHILREFKNDLNVLPVFVSQDKYIEKICESVLAKLNYKNVKNKIYFYINESGTSCECEMNNKKYSYSVLCDFVSFYNSAPESRMLDFWRNDAVLLSFTVLRIISEYDMDFCAEIENIPSFYVAERIVETKRKLPYFASRFSENQRVSFSKNELSLDENDLRFRVMDNGKHNKIKVLARSHKAEFAEELALKGEKLLLDIDML